MAYKANDKKFAWLLMQCKNIETFDSFIQEKRAFELSWKTKVQKKSDFKTGLFKK